ncbi:MraY family glycosyltransferase [Gilvimarinus sp. 1_MG-2023]|uniref:MraY family glycosyltransferase n=1 Tax=Gilvimarinus sp. 1_MG-2023 TaxID=3062638 RepID=UPI0026E3060F|nr:glycosyltransferase family 4 protein [Gilvimarinus sp. 1_MG-2023]MDO6745916.1 glycosyltransferase family 4 protein [Gilvimarinus sp. 1_MG-2023]
MALLFLGFVLGALLTGAIRMAVSKMHMLDVPGERSSHTLATPRGGGVSIILIAIVGGVLLLPVQTVWPILLSALWVGCVGLYDDYRQASRRLRLIVQLLSAAVAVFCIRPEALSLSGWLLTGVWLWLLLLVWFVWCTNLYNFMDGINGLAALEAISVLLSLCFLLGVEYTELAHYFLLLAGAVFGFLLWNFPNAKIFMGDSGSAFLGALFAALSVYFVATNAVMFWALLILMGVFVVDSTCTLLRRAILRQAIFNAHRTHAYQYSARALQSHTKVTLLAVVVNVCWLLPWAVAVVVGSVSGVVGLLVAYTPLVSIALRLKAGKPEKETVGQH